MVIAAFTDTLHLTPFFYAVSSALPLLNLSLPFAEQDSLLYIRESVLDEIVLRNLRDVTEFAREHTDEFYARATENGEVEAEKFYRTAERERQQIDKRISELDNIIRCLYEDRVCGRITPGRYDTMASEYEQEQTSLKEKLATVKERIANMDMRESCIREFIAKAKQYVDMPKLTPELLRVFIRKIEVFEKAEKYSRTAGNLIVIHYAFRLPEQDGLPVLEPLMSKAIKKLPKKQYTECNLPSVYIPPQILR